MKKFVAIFVTVCLLLQCAAQLGVMGMYQIRKDYVAQKLCVNRDKPKLKCNGKCHLKKQLKKASEQQEKKESGQNEESSVMVSFVLPAVWSPAYKDVVTDIRHNSICMSPEGILLPADIFHPPQA